MDLKIHPQVFNDPIHGHVELHPLLVKITDTPQFQRLRNIKQLGGGYFVYPGACHKRFEHSIGVAHLAGELAKALQSRQPGLNITDRDILCVQIAGLCHDLGHGPFSHLFDGMFIPEACKGQKKWKHEDASIEMFDHVVKSNKLREVMRKKPYSLDENDEIFIKEMINGPQKDPEAAQAEWPYKGRTRDKSFLYEIVSNKRNGIDVDKFDYFARDCHHLGIQNNFDHWRFIKFARVCDVEGEKRICSRDKEVGNLYNMFHTRNYLHRRAYQHRVTKSVEIMIKDAFMKANNHIKIQGSNGKMFKLSEAKNDMEAYSKLTDHLFEYILYSESKKESQEESEESKNLKGARDILKRIISRDLYKFVGEALLTEKKEVKKEEEKGKKEDEKQKQQASLTQAFVDAGIPRDDFEVVVVTFDYGMKDKDPLADTYFYRKEDPDKAYPINQTQVRSFLPARFFENIIRVYWKNTDKTKLNTATRLFREWCEKNGFEELRNLNKKMKK
ncbi:deoxynucleoside triphosphate triphosphohydrolase SAMHD1-like isoform X2 [Mugil cephalus]|uniref:deoxynucleoside triphosphate triphosphohydrolase SAMHD1-like isoform X2 n=1 Tax=Mugil cephalus TaxID=48193 RepID=UPI001FB66BC4|nr:deoxynucleoside triphosphate triphosphohydrolase SAMHD1-like isoform X2 [Mugil cephalus]